MFFLWLDCQTGCQKLGVILEVKLFLNVYDKKAFFETDIYRWKQIEKIHVIFDTEN